MEKEILFIIGINSGKCFRNKFINKCERFVCEKQLKRFEEIESKNNLI